MLPAKGSRSIERPEALRGTSSKVAGNTRRPAVGGVEVRAETLLTKDRKRLRGRKVLETSSSGDWRGETAKSLPACKAECQFCPPQAVMVQQAHHDELYRTAKLSIPRFCEGQSFVSLRILDFVPPLVDKIGKCRLTPKVIEGLDK